MSSILLVADGFPSLFFPCLQLANRLAAAGNDVTVASDPRRRALVERHGLDFRALEPSRYEPFLDADRKLSPLERLATVTERRRRALESTNASRFARQVRDVSAELVLIDGEMHEHVLAALGAGARVAIMNAFVSIWKSPGLPPPHCLVRPGQGWKGTALGMEALWMAARERKRWKAWSQWAKRLGCDRVSLLKRLARESEIDFRGETDFSQWLIPFTYKRLPVVCLHAREFEFPHEPPEHVRYVGPMILADRMERPVPELQPIFARCRRGGGERTLIYAGFGSVGSAGVDLLARLVRVVAEREDWELLIGLSDRIESSTLGSLPERVHAFSWVPQLAVLQHADVAVTHGGINTIDECVASGVPMLIYCGHETDMAGNTSRVEHHAIGIAGDRRNDTTSIILGHIDRLLTERHFADNVATFQKHYDAYETERVAERAVAELLETAR